MGKGLAPQPNSKKTVGISECEFMRRGLMRREGETLAGSADSAGRVSMLNPIGSDWTTVAALRGAAEETRMQDCAEDHEVDQTTSGGQVFDSTLEEQ